METDNKRRATDFDRSLGKRLKQRRVALGLSVSSLAKGIGISENQLIKYENGENRMPPERIQTCAKMLKVSISYFFDEELALPEDKIAVRIAGTVALIRCTEIKRGVLALVKAINDNWPEEQDRPA